MEELPHKAQHLSPPAGRFDCGELQSHWSSQALLCWILIKPSPVAAPLSSSVLHVACAVFFDKFCSALVL